MDSLVYVIHVTFNYNQMICYISLNQHKRMKVEPSRQIPEKLSTSLEPIELFSSISIKLFCAFLFIFCLIKVFNLG